VSFEALKVDFSEVIHTRRSVRAFKRDPIPEDVLSTILNAARIAPSGSNRQPWRLILVTDDVLKQKMISACNNQEFVAQAPVLVVACGQKLPINRGGYMGEMSMLLDVSIAFTHLVLAARAEGLGTCWIGAFNNGEIKKLLHIPDEYEVVAATPLGFPENQNAFSQTSKRKTLDEIVSTNKF
jgi:nitroreductase